MIQAFVSLFSRIVIGMVFILSFSGKLRDISSFQNAINEFRLSPEWVSPYLALVFLAGELVVAVAMILGGRFLSWGFMLAGLMLVVFSIALLSVIIRRIDASCNCFGSSGDDRVSTYEILRNASFILCAFIGYIVPAPEQIPYLTAMSILAGLTGLIFVLIMLNLKNVIELFKN
jgi:Methylamine utilisation protein MauE